MKANGFAHPDTNFLRPTNLQLREARGPEPPAPLLEALEQLHAHLGELLRAQEQLRRQNEELAADCCRTEEALRQAQASAGATAGELALARRIQQQFFPAAAPRLPGLDLGGASYPAVATGGDYYDYIPMPDGCLAVVIGDVTGHGFGPALLMAATRACVRAFAQTHTDVGRILTLTNRVLAADLGPEHFVTLALVRLDPQTHSLIYASAGHPTGYLLDPAGAVKQLLPSTDWPLGIEPRVAYTPSPPIPLAAGDGLLLLTDGVVEARSAGGVVFGVERALGVFQAHRHESAQAIVVALHAAVRGFGEGEPQRDDITAVVLKVGP